MAATERARRENGRETRRRMLRAASELMAESGVAAVTLSAAAERAGITRRAAYHHFAGREDLLFELRRSLNEKLLKSVQGDHEFGEPRDLLLAMAEQDDSALRFHVYEMLNHGLRRSALFKSVVSQLTATQKAGKIKPEVDIEMFAVVAVSAAFFGATVAMTLAKTPKERHTIAERFSKELRQTIQRGCYL